MGDELVSKRGERTHSTAVDGSEHHKGLYSGVCFQVVGISGLYSWLWVSFSDISPNFSPWALTVGDLNG